MGASVVHGDGLCLRARAAWWRRVYSNPWPKTRRRGRSLRTGLSTCCHTACFEQLSSTFDPVGIMCRGTIAVMVLALALLAFSTTTVSSFVISSRTSTEHSFVAATNACRRCRRSSDTRTATRSSSRGSRQRQELTCGLQITVRIRGKKSREEDYTNQVRCNMLMGRLLRPRARSSCMDSVSGCRRTCRTETEPAVRTYQVQLL